MSRVRRVPPYVVALSILPIISGCVVGPRYRRPALPPAHAYAPRPLPPSTASAPGIAAGTAQSFDAAQAISAQWWTLFRSPPLDSLIKRAFAANPTIDAAVAALKQAQENVYAQRGLFYPTV